MSTSIQQAINPPVARNNQHDFSDAKVSDSLETKTTENKKQTDFRTLITNSMDDVMKERKAKENGDLSSGSDAEFLQKLADKTKEKKQAKNELGKDDFMKLFVTQLQNQDPLNPDDGTEMATKLATFNGLEQMMNVNKGIDKLVKAQTMDRNSGMINYIGKEVTVEGGKTKMKNGNAGSVEFTSQAPMAAATLEIRDSNGILVNQVDLGPKDAGTHQAKWDGKAQDGKQALDGVYTYSVVARNAEGDPVPTTMVSKARITGVDIQSEEGTLFSDFGKIKFEDIKSVGKPGFDEAEAARAGLAAVNVPTPPQAGANQPPVPSAAEGLDRLAAEGKLDLGRTQAPGTAPGATPGQGATANPSPLPAPVQAQPPGPTPEAHAGTSPKPAPAPAAAPATKPAESLTSAKPAGTDAGASAKI